MGGDDASPPGVDEGSIPPPAPPENRGSETPPCNDQHPIYYAAWSAAEQQSHLWVVNPDGSGKRQLMDAPLYALSVALSPLGDRIAFLTNEGDSYALFVVDVDGSHLRRLSAAGAAVPQWSPDGQQILLGGALITVATGEVRHLSDEAPEASWSPSGDGIAYVSRGGGLWVMNADGSGARQLTDLASNTPVWSPNGDQIAFGSHVSGEGFSNEPGHIVGEGGVYVINRDGSGLLRLGDGRVTQPSRLAFSPDGTRVLVSPDDMYGMPSVWVVNIDGSGQRRLTPTDYSYKATWSPNGTCVVLVFRPANGPTYSPGFQMQSPGTGDLWIMDADGANARSITQDAAEEVLPLWQERFSASYFSGQ